MKRSTINVSTGPVQISLQVMEALGSAPVSHRSKEFHHLYYDTTEYLCNQFNTQQCYILTGSGTAANEAMISQIKMLAGKGLILSNGEFGERLIKQATRSLLSSNEIKLAWGEQFDAAAIESEIKQHEISWLLFCHCETSTGVMNDLDNIAEVCNRNNCRCFVDCMSTVGTYPLDLSKVAMATASSGKGLASIPGLAIVFSNIEPVSSNEIPIYFDLAYYDKKDGVPYTISSNFVNALNVAARQKLRHEQFELIESYSQDCFNLLNETKSLPFNNARSKVFTISSSNAKTNNIASKLKKEQVTLSFESEYLRCRDWSQIALFGYYQQNELKFFLQVLQRSVVPSWLKR
jgi:aspartate aminotransferase-like enzyme